MYSLLLALIYFAFISLGLPDSLLGSGWPVMHAELGVPVSYMGVVSMVISCGTIVSSLLSDKLTRKLGTGGVTAASVLLTVLGLFGFSVSTKFWMLLAFPCRTVSVRVRSTRRSITMWRCIIRRAT